MWLQNKNLIFSLTVTCFGGYEYVQLRIVVVYGWITVEQFL